MNQNSRGRRPVGARRLVTVPRFLRGPGGPGVVVGHSARRVMLVSTFDRNIAVCAGRTLTLGPETGMFLHDER